MQENISFIHCADLHIDSPFVGLSYLPNKLLQEVKKSTFDALNRLVETAIAKQVDFVLMVGDIFDQTVQSVYAQMQFLKACEVLEKENIMVYVSFGNHDYLNRNLLTFQFPDNVRLFTEENVQSFIFERDQKQVATIYGFSYLQRAVIENKTEQYKIVSDTPYHIAMLHGSVAQQTDHDTYAPFQLSELTEKGFDYWALGHIHKRQQLKNDPPVVYAGNTQGRSKKETGEKGCYHVELGENSNSLTFCPLQVIRFEDIEVDLKMCTSLQALEQIVDEEVQQIATLFGKSVIRLRFYNYIEDVETWYYEEMLTDVIEFINEKMMSYQDWVWIQEVKLSKQNRTDKEKLRQGEDFLGELLRTFDEDKDFDETVKSVWKHRQARKFLEKLTDEEKMEVKTEAENLLIYQLLRKEER
ncbi:DNA repair exonuclease [Paraliobacillus sp. X-1268]|uniref:metallophosphoesterase family protein n=1 Tax=Paraliobacillus sp. X-1268 TaxID=2213193 RepID=UPI000E3BAFA1|nr:DNA repair exonuclease [Paraliobacillus sp. X-1268]